jgi:hypothetical protein
MPVRQGVSEVSQRSIADALESELHGAQAHRQIQFQLVFLQLIVRFAT